MTTCANCRHNKFKKDPDIGVKIYYCDHGTHTLHSETCSDFLPTQSREDELDSKIMMELHNAIRREKDFHWPTFFIMAVLSFMVCVVLFTPVISMMTIFIGAVVTTANTGISAVTTGNVAGILPLIGMLALLIGISKIVDRC
jgi:hypothetical protein